MVMLHHMFSICNKVNFEPKFDLKIFIYLKKKKKRHIKLQYWSENVQLWFVFSKLLSPNNPRYWLKNNHFLHLYSQCIFCISPWFWLSYHCGSTLDLFSIIRRQETHCCCILFTTVTLHLFTLPPDNINLMQSEHQQHKICGHKENLLWHIYTLWGIKKQH